MDGEKIEGPQSPAALRHTSTSFRRRGESGAKDAGDDVLGCNGRNDIGA